MAQNLGIGILAGLVSALLFGVLVQASPLAVVLYLLAPLPILIVGLGWSHKAALAAVAAGSFALALGVTPYLGLAFSFYLGLPAWWLAYLALLGREQADGRLEWYPLGRLLAWTAGTAALAFVAIAVIAAPNYETFRTQLTQMSRKVVQIQMRGRGAQPAPTPEVAPEKPVPQEEPLPVSEGPRDLQDEIAQVLATVAPGVAAQGLTVLLAFYLWLAGRIVQVSGRLPRPWPDIPATGMPRSVLAGLAAGMILFQLQGYVGTLGAALIGSFSLAFALQGLAFLHDVSRGKPGRLPLLILTYLFALILGQVVLPILAMLGMADTATSLRERLAARSDRKPPPLPPT